MPFFAKIKKLFRDPTLGQPFPLNSIPGRFSHSWIFLEVRELENAQKFSLAHYYLIVTIEDIAPNLFIGLMNFNISLVIWRIFYLFFQDAIFYEAYNYNSRIRKDPSNFMDPDPFGQKRTDPEPSNPGYNLR